MADNHLTFFLAKPDVKLRFADGLMAYIIANGGRFIDGLSLVAPMDPQNHWGPRLLDEYVHLKGDLPTRMKQVDSLGDVSLTLHPNWCPSVCATNYSSADPQVICWIYDPFGRKELQSQMDQTILGFAHAVCAAYVITSFAGFPWIFKVLERQADGYRFIKSPVKLRKGKQMISIDISPELGGIDPTSGTIAPVTGLPFGYVRYPLC